MIDFTKYLNNTISGSIAKKLNSMDSDQTDNKIDGSIWNKFANENKLNKQIADNEKIDIGEAIKLIMTASIAERNKSQRAGGNKTANGIAKEWMNKLTQNEDEYRNLPHTVSGNTSQQRQLLDELTAIRPTATKAIVNDDIQKALNETSAEKAVKELLEKSPIGLTSQPSADDIKKLGYSKVTHFCPPHPGEPTEYWSDKGTILVYDGTGTAEMGENERKIVYKNGDIEQTMYYDENGNFQKGEIKSNNKVLFTFNKTEDGRINYVKNEEIQNINTSTANNGPKISTPIDKRKDDIINNPNVKKIDDNTYVLEEGFYQTRDPRTGKYTIEHKTQTTLKIVNNREYMITREGLVLDDSNKWVPSGSSTAERYVKRENGNILHTSLNLNDENSAVNQEEYTPDGIMVAKSVRLGRSIREISYNTDGTADYRFVGNGYTLIGTAKHDSSSNNENYATYTPETFTLTKTDDSGNLTVNYKFTKTSDGYIRENLLTNEKIELKTKEDIENIKNCLGFIDTPLKEVEANTYTPNDRIFTNLDQKIISNDDIQKALNETSAEKAVNNLLAKTPINMSRTLNREYLLNLGYESTGSTVFMGNNNSVDHYKLGNAKIDVYNMEGEENLPKPITDPFGDIITTKRISFQGKVVYKQGDIEQTIIYDKNGNFQKGEIKFKDKVLFTFNKTKDGKINYIKNEMIQNI